MVLGYVLVTTAPGKEHDVFNIISNVDQVVDIHLLFGEYDIIVKIEADDFDAVGQIVVEHIRTIEGVIDTKTMTGIDFR